MRYPLSVFFRLSFLTLTLTFIGCGKGASNQFVKSAQVQTRDIDGEDWISLSTVVEVGGAQVPSLTLPIVDPRFPSEVYGQIGLRPVLGSVQSTIELSVNLSKVTGLNPSIGVSLPNGNALPISTPAGIDMIELAIPQIGSKIYLALGPQTIMLGWALAIKEFDVVARYLPGANIFLGFQIGPVRGNAGVFTSTISGKSGFALFADLGQVFYAQEGVQKGLASTQEVIRFRQIDAKSSQLSGLNRSMKYLQGRRLELK